ncbi:hypothetical protein, partial [Pseudomonas sp. MPR-R5A]|uniref:hypothetical protein n=1 Tax=Pseudomonas sp. MPR-R5A TaxID=2070626 RepID=UPI000CAFC84F
TGTTRREVESLWAGPQVSVPSSKPPYVRSPALYGPDKILAYSNGKPSEAFGDKYLPFDKDRIIARLPGPPYQFLDRIVETKGEPWVLK